MPHLVRVLHGARNVTTKRLPVPVPSLRATIRPGVPAERFELLERGRRVELLLRYRLWAKGEGACEFGCGYVNVNEC